MPTILKTVRVQMKSGEKLTHHSSSIYYLLLFVIKDIEIGKAGMEKMSTIKIMNPKIRPRYRYGSKRCQSLLRGMH